MSSQVEGGSAAPPSHGNALRRHVRGWPPSLKVVLVAIVVLGSLNLAVAIPKPSGWDASGYYAWGQALLQNANFDPTPFLPVDAAFPRLTMNGKVVALNKYPIGWSLADLPFMAIGKASSKAAAVIFGNHWSAARASALIVRISWLGILAWVLIGIVACDRVLAMLGNAGSASVATVCAWLGTSAFAQTWKCPGISHGLSMALLAVTYLYAVAYALKPGVGFALAWGFFAGLTVCTRNPNLVLLTPGAYMMMLKPSAGANAVLDRLHVAEDWPRRLGQVAVWGACGAAPLVAVQLFAWHSVYGQWIFNGYAVNGEHFKPSLLNLSAVLLTSWHGVFWRHPIVMLSIAGAAAGALGEKQSATRVLSLLIFLLLIEQILQYGSWPSWIDVYGARWTSDSMSLWALGLMMLQRQVQASQLPKIRIAAWSLAGLSALMLVVQIFVLRAFID